MRLLSAAATFELMTCMQCEDSQITPFASSHPAVQRAYGRKGHFVKYLLVHFT